MYFRIPAAALTFDVLKLQLLANSMSFAAELEAVDGVVLSSVCGIGLRNVMHCE